MTKREKVFALVALGVALLSAAASWHGWLPSQRDCLDSSLQEKAGNIGKES